MVAQVDITEIIMSFESRKLRQLKLGFSYKLMPLQNCELQSESGG
jgi:hypothetical protein